MNDKEGFKLNVKTFFFENAVFLLTKDVFFYENMVKMYKASGEEHGLHQRELSKKRNLIRTDRVKGGRDQSKKTSIECLCVDSRWPALSCRDSEQCQKGPEDVVIMEIMLLPLARLCHGQSITAVYQELTPEYRHIKIQLCLFTIYFLLGCHLSSFHTSFCPLSPAFPSFFALLPIIFPFYHSFTLPFILFFSLFVLSALLPHFHFFTCHFLSFSLHSLIVFPSSLHPSIHHAGYIQTVELEHSCTCSPSPGLWTRRCSEKTFPWKAAQQ